MAAWLRLLRDNAPFRRIFLAHSISRAGDAFNTVALVVLVLNLTGSGLGVAGTVALEVLPILLLGPVLGIVVDRYSRRSVMVSADVGRALLALTLAIFTTVPIAYVVAFGLSTFAQAFNPAVSSVVPEVVAEEELVDANSALWTVAVMEQVVLAPLAGGLIVAFGVAVAFSINAASFLLSAAFLIGLDAGRTPAAVGRTGWREVLAGVEAVKRHSLLSRLAIVQALAALSAGATGGLLLVYAEVALNVDASGFGLLLSAIGIGAALGPLLLRRFIRPAQRLWLFGPFALRGGLDLTLAATSSLFVALPALALYGVGTSTGMVAYQSTLQREIPDEVRGRAFTFYDVLWNGSRLVSLGLGGVLADAVGIRFIYAAGGVLLVLAFLVGVVSQEEQAGRQPSSRGKASSSRAQSGDGR